MTALHEAVKIGSIEEVERLVSSEGQDPNQFDEQGFTPLARAMNKNDIAMMKALLHNGASPNTPNRNGSQLLFWAVEDDKAEIVQLLIEYGVDVNPTLAGNWTPLMNAVDEFVGLECALLLLKAGANVFIKNDRGQTALDIARHAGRAAWQPLKEIDFIIRLLEEHSEPT